MNFYLKYGIYMANVCSPWKLIVTNSYCSTYRVIDLSTIPRLEIVVKTFRFNENRELKLSLFEKTAVCMRMRNTRARINRNTGTSKLNHVSVQAQPFAVYK